MAKENIETPNLFNPMMLWTDMGRRALEMTLSSSQNIGDGNRETISQEPPPPALPVFPDLNLFWQMQRASIELMTQGWQQWMNAIGMFGLLGAGGAFAETARQNPMLNAMQEILRRSTDETATKPNARSRSS
jgi:hypothetical protein